jgi:hypothetical protein
VALSFQPTIVATINVVLWPSTNSEISFAARLSSPASSTMPAMNNKWSQPSSMCSIPSGMNPHRPRLAASPPIPCAKATPGRPTSTATVTALSTPARRREARIPPPSLIPD